MTDHAIKETIVERVVPLIELGERALFFYRADQSRKVLAAKLREAYRAWKIENNVERVERGSPLYHSMMTATKDIYEALELAKADLRIARGRLDGRARRIIKTFEEA